MRVLIIGARGQLGVELCRAFYDHELYKADLDGGNLILDITDLKAVQALIGPLSPDLVINTAAAHNVPLCEERPEWAYQVNAEGAKNMAIACAAAGARLVHISTDYVFGNGATKPRVETDRPDPVNVYGASKLEGEGLIAHHAFNYCIATPCRAKNGKNFIDLMLHLARTKGEVRVVTDEITTPTYSVALARQIRLMAEKAKPGLYHATCQGHCSWYDFAKVIFDRTRTKVALLPARSSDFPAAVKRPNYSVLENANLKAQGLDIMPNWSSALGEYLAQRSDGSVGSV